MSEIIYSSLVKLPLEVNTKQEALELIYKHVEKPAALNDVKSEVVLVDNMHINIIRYFVNVEQYKDWIFSKDRNDNDKILIENGFYLYTKQAHL
tara:strand:- start:620 stop:901 length:282 start_codon:yes stop_codon:yes gene_type:complete